MAKPPLGTGARYKALKGSLMNQAGVKDPGALAAEIGRKKLGKAKFQKLVDAGKN